MKRVKGLLLSTIAFTLLGVQAQPLEIGLNQIVKSLSPNTNISVMVYDLHTQRPIYQYHPHQRLTAASTMKLWTSVASLLALTPEFELKTELWMSGSMKHHTWYGDVWLVFEGDPSFSTQALKHLLKQLHQKGIDRIQGRWYVVAAPLANDQYGPGWMWDELPACYAAPLSRLMLDENCFKVHILPPRIGHRPRLEPSAPSFIQWQNRLVRRPQCSASDLPFQVKPKGFKRYEWSGCIASNQANLSIAIPEPFDWVSYQILKQLKILKIQGVHRIHLRQHRPSLISLNRVAVHHSSLKTWLKPMLTDSNNVYASQLFLHMGFQRWRNKNTWARSAKTVQSILKSHQIDAPKMIDGSGLSRLNHASASDLFKLLYRVINVPEWSSQMIPALAQLGRSGTLSAYRVNVPDGVEVLGKTGSMQGVSNIAGMIYADHSARYLYAILLEGGLSQHEHQKRIHAIEHFLDHLIQSLSF
ncbi:MAG: D-alanyl-D-alanine carboxypeptidase/D-alanyl-D-alanine-endopeptidase [Legionellales bacterium]|nr:D-alanyl-D-alanine carboxypeptidase/D-alanyl-D-alanine-endopeptidase [Legionellales bacterium]